MSGYRGSDHRTPMAWQHRDINIAEPGHSHRHQRDQTPPARHGGYPSPTRHSGDNRSTPGSRSRSRSRGHSRDRHVARGYSSERPGGGRGYRSGTSPSSTDNTTEDTTETDSHTVDTVDRERDGSEYHGQDRHAQPGYPMMVGYPMLAPPQLAHVGPLLMPGTGSIRSVQSVPMLSHGHHTWDGEPCPVHHQHPMVPLAALYGMPGYAPSMSLAYSVPPSVISGATTVRRARSVAELSQAPHPPHGHGHGLGHAHGQMEQDRRSLHASMASLGHSQAGHLRAGPPRMVVAENGAPSKLPMRDTKKISPVPSKDEKKAGIGCCSGHFVVMWIILGIVTFGVLLGIVLKFTVST